MPQTRRESLIAVLDDIEAFEFSLDHYYDDPEPRDFIDNILTGKIDCLLAFCRSLGWSELVSQLQVMTPFQGDAVSYLESIKGFVIPEARRLLALVDVESLLPHGFWEFIHPRVRALARPRFEAGHFADAIETSFKEINETVKRIVKDKEGRELDGAPLMNTAFSPNKPIICLSPLGTETDRSIQQGYMQIMAGSMIGIRNPTAHANLNPGRVETLHLIALASLLMHKIDGRHQDCAQVAVMPTNSIS